MKKKFSLGWTAILAKSAKFIKVFKVIKLLKFSSIFLTILTMALSTFTYSFFLGPWFAIGLVLMLFIHEMGHVVALKMKGFPASMPVFIPMLGAVIFAPAFGNREDEAFVGYGGPLLGSLAGLALFGIWYLLPEKNFLLLSISHIAIFLNLFNLIPLRPLDGGRITQAAGGWFKYAGIAILFVFTLYIHEPGFLLVWILTLDDINMNRVKRFVLSIIFWFSMVILMMLGYGTQHWLVDGLDILLGFYFIIRYRYLIRHQMEDEERENTKQLPKSARIKWSVAYVTILIVLLWTMSVQNKFLVYH